MWDLLQACLEALSCCRSGASVDGEMLGSNGLIFLRSQGWRLAFDHKSLISEEFSEWQPVH